MRRTALAWLIGAWLLAGGCGGGETRVTGDPVTAYCSYGAVSQAQLEGCEGHVESDYIDSLDTNAAEYSRGELDECLDDAGPFCEGR